MTITEFIQNLTPGRRRKKANRPKKEGIITKSVWIPRLFRGDYTMQNSELLFAAVSRISNALSAMPVHLYRGSTPVKNHLNDLVSFSPNPNMTSCTFFKTFEACRCTSGNGYALKIYDEQMKLQRIDIIDPSFVQPMLEDESNELWFRIQPTKGEPFYVHNYYMIHVPFISTNGYTGLNPVSVLYDTISYAENIQTFSAAQLEKGINAAVVLSAPANLGESQRRQMIADFTDTYKESGGNILLLESGVTAQSLHLSPVDANLLEVEKITRSKVAMVYNIPPHMLGDYSDTSYSSQEQQTLEFLMLTMLPIVTAYEAELNRKLLTQEQRRRGYYWKFEIDSMMRADAATQAEVDYKAVRSAWKTPDEIRMQRNLPPLPGGIGKYAMISQDLASLEYTVNDKPRVLMAKLDNTRSIAPEEREDG